MLLVDTHAHLYAKEFEPDQNEMVERSIAAGVSRIFLPNIDLDSIDGMLKLEATNKVLFQTMMGLHPCSVKENYKAILSEMYAWINRKQFCAIGEIGIDLYWDKTFLHEQIRAFETQIKWAMEKNLPIVIHSRNSFNEVVNSLEKIKQELGMLPKGIFHCFAGSIEEAEKIIDLGFLIGVGGVVTFRNAKLDTVLKQISLSNIVLETDAPYLAPVPHRGKRNESSYLLLIAKRLAEIYQVDVKEIAEITTSNALKVFNQEM